MDVLIANQNQIVLDIGLKEYLRKKASPEFIIYHQLLAQLHLPCEKWKYDKIQKGYLLIELLEEMEEMDQVRFKQLEFSRLISPLRLYTYYLLQAFLGNEVNFGGIGILPGTKTRFLFLDSTFDIDQLQDHQFSANAISRFVMKSAYKKELMTIHEAFFVLINQKFKPKLLNALTLYQSETGQKIDKIRFVNKVLAQERIDKLNVFSFKQIARL